MSAGCVRELSRRMLVLKVSLFAVVLYFLSPIAIAKIQNSVINGEDRQVQFFQIERSEVREVADSAARGNSKSVVTGKIFQQLFNVCHQEPLSSEPAAAIMCSAFVAGNDLIADADHCFQSELERPSAIPTNVFSEAAVRGVYHAYFQTSLDMYAGNSGFAIFNNKNIELVSILAQGEAGFSEDRANQCSTNERCEDADCRGEGDSQNSYLTQASNYL